MNGKRALITGGTSGLGAAIAAKLASLGVICALNYASNTARAEESLKRLSGQGHILVQGSPFTKAGATTIVNDAVKGLSGLDYIVSNAGWTRFGTFDDLNSVSDEDWDQCYTANVKSHLWILQAAREELEKTQGSVVLTASVAGILPSGSSMAYAVSKAATIHLAKSLARALAPKITVNAVSPGVLQTEWSKGFSDEQLQTTVSANALRRLASVEDAADIYVMLLSSSSITGQNIEVSAGFHL